MPGHGQFAIFGQNQADDFALLFAHPALIGETELPAAPDPFGDFGIAGLHFLVEPGELRPHLEIAKFLIAEETARARTLLRLPGVIELAVARIAVDHALRVGVEGMAEEE